MASLAAWVSGCAGAPQVEGASGDAARARDNLGLTQLAEAPTVRRVWKGATVDFEGRPSPDARYVSTTDWGTGDLALRDLAADTSRRLTGKGSWETSSDFAESSVISPDGKSVVFGWYSTGTARFELRTMPIAGADSGRARTIFAPPDLTFAAPQSFTPDGRSVATVISRADRTTQIGLIPLDGGPARILKSFDWRSPNDLMVSPDGRWLAYDFPPDANEGARDVYVVALDGSREAAVLRDKGNDMAAGWSRDGTYLLVGSERDGTTGLWALPMTAGKPQGDPLLVRADVWRMTPMGTSADGSIFYGVLTGERDIYTAAFDAKAGKVVSQPVSASGGAFNASPNTVAFSPDGQHVAYLVARGSGSNPYSPSDVVIRSVERGEVRRIAPELARISRVYWLPDGKSLLVRGADEKGRGGLYRMSLADGAVTLVYRHQTGFSNSVAIDRTGSRAYFATTSSKVATIHAVDLASGAVRTIYTAAHGFTLWGIAVSPDERHLALALRTPGQGSGTIQIVSIDRSTAESGTARELYHFPNSDDLAAYAGLAWSPDGAHVYFGATGPRRADVAPISEIRRVAVAGGAVELTDVARGPITAFQLSPDGRRVAYGVSDFSSEVWVMAPPAFAAPTAATGKGR